MATAEQEPVGQHLTRQDLLNAFEMIRNQSIEPHQCMVFAGKDAIRYCTGCGAAIVMGSDGRPERFATPEELRR